MSAAPYLLWTERLLGFALLLQTVELVQLRRHFADDGLWSWPVLAAELCELPPPLRALCAWLLPYRPFLALLLLRLLLAPLLTAGVVWAAPGLLVTQLAIGARFRGTFNGGSDYMSVVVLLALSGAACCGGSPHAVDACLAYVCVQLIFSYFIAGTVKLPRREWRSGEALARLLSSNRYGTPLWLQRLAGRPALARAAARGLLLFECAFPLALAEPRATVAFAAAGALFHAGNVLAFGLNRFFFAWLAAYPALFYFSAQLSRP